MWRVPLFTLLSSLIFGSQALEGADNKFFQCIWNGNVSSPGVSIPRGDTYVKVGSPGFYLHCHLNPQHEWYRVKGLRSDRLFFEETGQVKGNVEEGNGYVKKILESEIVNETTIRHWYRPPNHLAKDWIDCKVRYDDQQRRSICTQLVAVGSTPLPPENFTCISENWENIRCTWHEPWNPVPTNYSLVLSLPGRHSAFWNCPSGSSPSIRRQKTPKPVSPFSMYAERTGGECFLSSRTDPQYRQTAKIYMFAMNFSNPLEPSGDYAAFTVRHFDVVRPGPAVNVTITSSDPNSVTIYFKIPLEMHHFPPGVKNSVKIKSQFDERFSELDLGEFDVDAEEREFVADGLIPYALYTVEVRLLSGALDGDTAESRLWSEPVRKTGRPLSDVPRLPPGTLPGSFQNEELGYEKRMVFVYWRQIDEKFHYGPTFGYEVVKVLEGDRTQVIEPVKVTAAYAMFRPLSSQRNYTVFVASRNSNGTSVNASAIFVPSDRHGRVTRLEPRSTTKLAFPDRLYEISWLPPPEDESVHSYIVFWCLSETDRDRPYQCDGQLDWKRVDRSTRSVNVTVPTDDVYQFAVAAEDERRLSSGMVWTTCTILHNQVRGRMKPGAVIAVRQRSIKYGWHLGCLDRAGLITGYQLSYCTAESDDPTDDCVSNVNVMNVDPDVDHVWIEGLLPWTFYKVAVAMKSQDAVNEPSSFVVSRTHPAKPSSKVNDLQVRLVEPTAVQLTWTDPDEPNGEISGFLISNSRLNHLNEPVVRQLRVDGHHAGSRVSGLTLNSNYTFAVRPCVRLFSSEDLTCGDEVADVKVTTGAGASDRMESPNVRFINGSDLVVDWPQPFHAGGPIVRYDVRVASQAIGESHVVAVDSPDELRSKHKKVSLKRLSNKLDWSPDCENSTIRSNLFNFSIRAVTVDPTTGMVFLGPWSEEKIIQDVCYESPSDLALVVGLTAGVALFVVTVSFVLKYLIRWKCKTSRLMNEVDVRLDDTLITTLASKHNNRLGFFNGDGDANSFEMIDVEMRPFSGESNVKGGSESSDNPLIKKQEGIQMGNPSGSNTTSGCESGRNYTSDESEGMEKKQGFVENKGSPESVQHREHSFSYVTAKPLLNNGGAETRLPPSDSTPGDSQIVPSRGSELSPLGDAKPTELPDGYSRVSVNAKDGCYVDAPVVSGGRSSAGSTSPSSIETDGAFIRPTPPCLPPAKPGYISVAQANGLFVRNPGHYLKVGILPSEEDGSSTVSDGDCDKTITPLVGDDRCSRSQAPDALEESMQSQNCQTRCYNAQDVVGSPDGSQV